MIFLDKVVSKEDKVIKYVFRVYPDSNDIVEFSYIDNGTGKDIICVSCATMCTIGCKFCHCTDYIGKISANTLSSYEIYKGVLYIVRDLDIKQETLLISYMGCGEPLIWIDEVVDSMIDILNTHEFILNYKTIRFGMATCLPSNRTQEFFTFCEDVKKYNLPVKLHLSLHYTDNETRKVYMPNSLDIMSSIAACKFYKEYTGNNVELHYTLIDGINDRAVDAQRLSSFAHRNNFNVKLITYNEKSDLDFKQSTNLEKFHNRWLECSSEIYTPPGRDIGSSCGQFLFGTYQKWNIK